MILVIILLLILSYSILPTYFYKFTNLFRKKSSKKEIYLTFDDGPSTYTKKLLDLLKKENVKATFFMVASFIEKNIEVINKMKDEGHLLALHSFDHNNALFMSPKKAKKDFEKSINEAKKYEIDTNFYRPPWGHFNLFTLYYMKKYNLKKVLWNVMAQDWKGDISDIEIERRLLKRIKSGSIICLHDGRGENNAPSRTIIALERVIPILKERGFLFKTVEELYEK